MLYLHPWYIQMIKVILKCSGQYGGGYFVYETAWYLDIFMTLMHILEKKKNWELLKV